MHRITEAPTAHLVCGLTDDNLYSDEVPSGWPAVARVIHPPETLASEPMPWSWAQPSMAALTPDQVPHNTRPGLARDGAGVMEPFVGHMPPAIWALLLPHLRRQWRGQDVRGAIWDGWSEIYQQATDWQLPKVTLEHGREYLLFAGTIGDVLDEPPGWDKAHHWNPAWAYLWAADETWATITGIDAYSTYLLGPAELIDSVVCDDRLIARTITRDAPLPLPTADDHLTHRKGAPLGTDAGVNSRATGRSLTPASVPRDLHGPIRSIDSGS